MSSVSITPRSTTVTDQINKARGGAHYTGTLSSTVLTSGATTLSNEMTGFTLVNILNSANGAQKDLRLTLTGLAADGTTSVPVGSFVVGPGEVLPLNWDAVPRALGDSGKLLNAFTVELIEAAPTTQTLASARTSSTLAQVTGGTQGYSLIFVR
jgi:hypothetical protein